MTRPWHEIAAFYESLCAGGLRLGQMAELANRIAASRLGQALHGWTSMHDLCVTQYPLSYPYHGPRLVIAPKLRLRGIDIPLASAILTAIFPERFTVVDFRALESLGVKRAAPTMDGYLEYLAFCRRTAPSHGLTLRDLDRALWQSSKSVH